MKLLLMLLLVWVVCQTGWVAAGSHHTLDEDDGYWTEESPSPPSYPKEAASSQLPAVHGSTSNPVSDSSIPLAPGGLAAPTLRSQLEMNVAGSVDDYRIGPNDLLVIEVFQVDELSGAERVNANGQINLPLIGTVTVGGLTQTEAERLLEQELEKDFLQNPQVDIFIEEFTSQRVTVMGSVNKPGVFPLQGRTTLLQAIALAEGVDRLADTETVVVFRKNPEGQVIGWIVDLQTIESGERPDPVLVNDDRIVVPKSGSRELIENVSGTLRGFLRFAIF
jgi:polysaccharide export outer membrane protein